MRRSMLYNAVMGAPSRHSLMLRAIMDVVRNVEIGNRGMSSLHFSGPGQLGQSFADEFRVKPQFKAGLYELRDSSGSRNRVLMYENVSCIWTVRPGHKIKSDTGLVMLHSEYPGYRDDQVSHGKHTHYSILWKQKRVLRN